MPNSDPILARAAEGAPLLDGQSAEPYFGYVTPNLIETRDFFTGKLGFEIRFESEWFVLLGLGAYQIGLLKPEQEGQSLLFRRAYPGHGAWITFDVPEVDALYRRAKDAGIPIAIEPRNKPWGERHFSLVAPNA